MIRVGLVTKPEPAYGPSNVLAVERHIVVYVNDSVND
jgi:hypothetical protein